MDYRFEKFSDDELYVLKRQAIEGSFNIVMTGNYNEEEKTIHNNLMNEIIDNIKHRKVLEGQVLGNV